jgi:hypothetical protein
MRMTAMAAGGRPEERAKIVSREGSLIVPRPSAGGQGRSSVDTVDPVTGNRRTHALVIGQYY